MFRHRPHRRKSNDVFLTVSILPVPADVIAIFGSPAKKIKHRFNAAATTLPNRTGPYRTAVGNDIRTGGRCFENVPTAAALLSKFTGTREFAARAILSARQRKRNRHQPTAAVIVPQTADMSVAVDINAGRGFLFRSGIFRVMGRTAHDD